MNKIHFHEQSASIEPNTSLEEFEQMLTGALVRQRAVLWQIGDMALAVERQHPKTFHQAYPEWVSPDLIARCKAVSAAYPPKVRNIQATWTVHMQMSKRPDRVAAVRASVEAGQTSDEARRDPPPPIETETPVVEQEQQAEAVESSGWLLAVDVNYFIHTYFHSGAGVESAATFVQWLQRLVGRLSEKGLTSVVCCLDSTTNHRREITAGWEHAYKPRSEKEPELVAQLRLVETMLHEANAQVVSIPDMEADDIMASYAKQYPGKVTLLTGDKDMRQCLSSTCNILQSVEWEENEDTRTMIPIYKWIVGKWPFPNKEKPDNVSCHTTDGSTYNSTKIVGITPEQWPHFQAIVGDSTDGIKGCEGIGAKGAMKLILEHGTVQGVIAAAKDGKIDLSATKRLAVLDFEDVAEAMLKLTTLRTDLSVPVPLQLCMKVTGDA